MSEEEKKRNILLIIEFDGTNFHGWQCQKNDRTVESVLKSTIKKMTGEEVKLYSSSRTDAGVHALAMPVCFFTKSKIPLNGFFLGLNSILPEDVKIKEVKEVDEKFHPRKNAISKTYLYRIFNFTSPSPIMRKFSWHFPFFLDIEKMKKASMYLIGEHDFSSFRAHHCSSISPYRNIYKIDIYHEYKHLLNIEITGNAFLKSMVRIIVGTLVEVGTNKRKPEDIKEILLSHDRKKAGVTAPPCGLFLKEVKFDYFTRQVL